MLLPLHPLTKISIRQFRIAVFLSGLLISGFLSLHAQTEWMQLASEAISQGQFTVAEKYYTQLLAETPTHLEARLGRAAVRSWQHKYITAVQDYQAALALAPDHLDAHNGLGFTLAWSGQLPEARKEFQRVLAISPDNLDARKGMAYAALWRGHKEEAIRRFKSLAASNPDQAEFALALSRAFLLNGQLKAARSSLQPVSERHPHESELQTLLHAIQEQPAYFELQGWAGYTSLGTANRYGLRGLEIAWRPDPSLRIAARYDNSLSFDNLSVVQGNRNIRAYYLGATRTSQEGLVSQVEVGRRILSEGQAQALVKAEQVFPFRNAQHLKVGGFTAIGDQTPNEWMAFAGYSFPITERFRLEPHYYHTRLFTSSQYEHRFLLSSNYHMTNGHQVSTGLMFGRAINPEMVFSRDLFGATVLWNMPMGKMHWLHFLFRFESGAQENFALAAAGIRFRIEQ